MPARRRASHIHSSKSYAESGSDNSDEGSVFSAGEDDEAEEASDEPDDAVSEEDESSEEDTRSRKRKGKSEPISKSKARKVSGGSSAPRGAAAGPSRTAGTTQKVVRKQDSDESDQEEQDQGRADDTEPSEHGDEIVSVTKLVPAPKEKHEKGKLGKPVIAFLTRLASPKYNDRDWFNANEKVWKWVKQDFEDFVAQMLESLMDEVDETVPYLPVKDMVYRIYRDVRFSNDKTPYKRTLMATFSRGGRKGPYAGYHLVVRHDGTGVHMGMWEPPSVHLNALRDHMKDNTPDFQRFKEIVSRPDFVEAFGAAKPEPKKGIKGSMWHGDGYELKTAPKGVDRNHPDIDFLRLKSFTVCHKFTDQETYNADPDRPGDFLEKMIKFAKLTVDFVDCLNEMVHPAAPSPPPPV